MKRFSVVVVVAFLGLAGAAGCKQEPKAAAPAAGHDAAKDAAAEDPLAGLSEADRAAVLAQKNCPVTGEALGSMGAPIKVTVEGRDVFLCCAGCVDLIKADPTKYFAILDGVTGPAAAGTPADAPASTEPAAEGETPGAK